MRPAQALDDFRRKLEALDYTRSRMENLYQASDIALRDLHSVYEALFLRAVTSFEAFLHDLFVGILNGRIKYRKGEVTLLMRASSHAALMDILLQGQAYLVWLPFDNTEERARFYLKNGSPFCDLKDGDKSLLKMVTLTRNAIAHASPHAVRTFKEKVIGNQALLPREKTPAGYLRSRLHQGGNRFEAFVGGLGRVAATICLPEKKDAA